MPKMIPQNTIILRREVEGVSKEVVIPPGEPADFTAKEIKEINEGHPGVLRKPINETAGDDEPAKTAGPAADGEKEATSDKPAAKPKATAKPKPDADDDL